MLMSLALLTERLKQDSKATIAENGSPDHLTRHAIGRDDERKIGFKFDTVNGPQPDGLTELIDVAVFPEFTWPAMLVTMQNPTQNLGEITDDEFTDIGIALDANYQEAGAVMFSAKGDIELDGNTTVLFFDKTEDGYSVTEVAEKLQGYVIDGEYSVIYTDGMLSLIGTAKLLANLKDDTAKIDDGADEQVTIGFGAKMARTCTIELAGEQKKVWAYTQKVDGEKTSDIYFLDFDTLKMVATTKFDGNYATPTRDGGNLIIVSSTIDEDGDGKETFKVDRRSTAGFLANKTDTVAALEQPQAE